MQVIAKNGMSLGVSLGYCFINGYMGMADDEEIVLDSSDANLPRIDRIVARLDISERKITLEILKGVPASDPVARDITRNSNIFELALADVRVNSNASVITQSNITDLRLNNEVCGIVAGLISQVSTTTIFNQYVAWFEEITSQASGDLEETLENFKSSFNVWFEEMREQLSEDAAGHLQLEINNLQADINNTRNKVNSLYDIFFKDVNYFNEDTTYHVGDYTIYDNKLYKTITEHTGAWNAEDFEQSSVFVE